MSITLELSPELEARLQTEAANRGVEANDYAQHVLSVFLQSPIENGRGELERLLAIEELFGVGIGAGFSSTDLHAQRQEERDREEAEYGRLFEGKRAA